MSLSLSWHDMYIISRLSLLQKSSLSTLLAIATHVPRVEQSALSWGHKLHALSRFAFLELRVGLSIHCAISHATHECDRVTVTSSDLILIYPIAIAYPAMSG